ncbi:hypothetical protein [Halococcus thailandensis]|uniref:Membrane-spanning protein n=1 Tax=Halococcus thailandensis JCM 13552 TaxID=1227457 RepID=M0N5K8_9EURY|nr:hypothetical protein [Halococcus thailandensis]EMA53151.1 hypothetical protein C451_10157 [Halococcus thailandensis JCM 13552]
MKIRRRIGLSSTQQAWLVRAMQAILAAVVLAGVLTGAIGTVTNAGIALAVTFLPAVLERRYTLTMDVGIVLWITTAMFLHAVGTLPLPVLDFASAYSSIWWYDHVTHALSSSLVAGVAYATTRAIDEHTEYIVMPPAFTFVYLLLFIVAFGVVWELLEFLIAEAAAAFGTAQVLTQYGLEDTALDLFYDILGGVLVAVFATAHLTDISDQLAARLDARRTR